MRKYNWRQNFLIGVNLVLGVFAFYFLAQLFYGGAWVNAIFVFVSGYLVTALNRAYRITAPPWRPHLRIVQDDWGKEFEEVVFRSRDELQLSGLYVPSENGAVVVMAHSWGGNRLQMRFHARPLVKAGFGVLAFDLRNHARSEGNVSTWGWLEVNDVLGAVDFVRGIAGVEAARVGVLGVALGGQIALRAAATEMQIRAVWADSPSPTTARDYLSPNRPTLRQQFLRPWIWLSERTQEWLTGVKAPVPLLDVMGNIAPRPVQLVASGPKHVKDVVRNFYEQAGEPKDLWEIDDISLGAAVIERGDDYDLKVVHFFNHTLQKSSD